LSLFGWKLCGFSLLISVLVVGLLGSTATVCASSFEHEQLFGGAQDDTAAQIIQTNDNGYAILGTTYSFGAGNADFWLIKVDQNKNPQWSKTYGGTQKDTANSLVQTNDGGYLLAGTTASFGLGNSSFWLVKVDPLGNLEWNQTYGTSTSELHCMIQTRDNGYVMLGTTTKNSTFFVWLVKTNENGNMQWNQTFLHGGVRTVVETSDGGFLLADSLTLPEKECASDAWLLKTDSYGNLQLNQTYDLCELFDYATNFVQNRDGTYTFGGMTGSFYSHDLWIVNVNSTGSMLWNTTFDTKENAYCTSLIQTNDQGYLLAATTNSFDLPDSDRYIVLVKLDQNGIVQYNQIHNSYDYYKNAYVTQTNNQNYALISTVKTQENTDYNILFFTTKETIPNSIEPMTFTSGVTLYSPVNTTYSSKFLNLNLTAMVGMGINCTITYSIDNKHHGIVPLKDPGELHVTYKVKGNVALPELTQGTHNLTLQVVSILNNGQDSRTMNQYPFIPETENIADYRYKWTDTIQFTIQTEQEISEFSAPTTITIILFGVLVVGTYKTKLNKQRRKMK